MTFLDQTRRSGARPHVLRVGRTNVGHGQRTFVIAEAGVNHNGDEATALRLVDTAAAAGADAVKFQIFTADALTTASAPLAGYQCGRAEHGSQRKLLKRLELHQATFRRIVEHCADLAIEFLATPFSCDDVDRLSELGTCAIKIASTDLIDGRLLRRACAEDLPLIVSTGAANASEVAVAVELIEKAGARDRLILLHCVSAYPTPMSCANLSAIAELAGRFATVVGYSDHTTSTLTGGFAVCAGAHVVEKHFTLDAGDSGPDHAMSLQPDALAEYVVRVREADAAVGTGDLNAQPIEEDVRAVSRKRVVTRRDVEAGELLVGEMLTLKRASEGFTADRIEAVIGKTITRGVAADTAITAEMID